MTDCTLGQSSPSLSDDSEAVVSPRVVSRARLCRGRHWRAGYVFERGDVVPDLEETLVESATLAFRPRMERAVRRDGSCDLACVASWKSVGGTADSFPLQCAAQFECALVDFVFRPAPSGCGADRDSRSLGSPGRNARPILETGSIGRLVVAALCPLGKFCYRS